MNAPALVEHLRDLRVDLSVSPAGKLHVEAPVGTLTDELRSELAAHRDELIAALAVPVAATQALDWPPPEPAWFAAWMREDDARRIATMAAAMQRRADNKRAHPRGNP